MTVSIIIPAYNQGLYIAEAIESALNQTFQDIEIIVVDDGSTDNTREVVAAYPQVIYVYQEQQGPASARNNGLRHTHGEYVQFLDADDMLLPEKIEKCLGVFDKNPDVGLVYTDYEVRTTDMKSKAALQPSIPQKPQGQVLKELVNYTATFFAPHCALTRREHIKAIGGFNEALKGTEDWYFWVHLAAYNVVFYHLDEVLVWTRMHGEQLSRKALTMAYARLKAYEALRDLPIPSDVIDLDREIAGRHHMVAIKLWETGQRAEARKYLLSAIHLDHHGRLNRLLLYLLSYFREADSAVKFLSVPSGFKRMMGKRS